MSTRQTPDKSSFYQVNGYKDRPIIVECTDKSCLMKSRLQAVEKDRNFYDIHRSHGMRTQKFARRSNVQGSGGDDVSESSSSTAATTQDKLRSNSVERALTSSLDQRDRPPSKRGLTRREQTSSTYSSGSPLSTSSSGSPFSTSSSGSPFSTSSSGSPFSTSSTLRSTSHAPSASAVQHDRPSADQRGRPSRTAPAASTATIQSRIPASASRASAAVHPSAPPSRTVPASAASASRASAVPASAVPASAASAASASRASAAVQPRRQAHGKTLGPNEARKSSGYTDSGLVGGLGSSPTRIGGKKSRRRKKTMHKATKKRKYIRYRKHRKSSKKKR